MHYLCFLYNAPLSAPPQMPTGIHFTEGSSTAIKVSWVAGNNGGKTQTFVLRYQNEGSDVTTEVTRDEAPGVPTYSVFIRGLLPSTTYDVMLWSQNVHGSSSVVSLKITTLGKGYVTMNLFLDKI